MVQQFEYLQRLVLATVHQRCLFPNDRDAIYQRLEPTLANVPTLLGHAARILDMRKDLGEHFCSFVSSGELQRAAEALAAIEPRARAEQARLEAARAERDMRPPVVDPNAAIVAEARQRELAAVGATPRPPTRRRAEAS